MRVLLVTKPLEPPWNDSGKVVPRDLVMGSSGRHELHVLAGPGDEGAWPPHVRVHHVYRDSGRLSPRRGSHLRLIAGVWSRRREFDLLHFFFQPHPAASRAARMLARACRRPAVHTVLSAPRAGAPVRGLLFADRSVTLSRHTAGLLAAAGTRPPDVVPPGLAETERIDPARVERARREAGVEAPFLLYPGDFEFSGGYELLLEAWLGAADLPVLLLAGRDKTPRAAERRRALEEAACDPRAGERVRVLGAVADMPALIAASAGLLFPAESLYAKSDLPIVVLETWREEKPVLVRDLPPLAEAVEGAGLVLPARAPEWAAAARSLAADGARLGALGRERFLERHTARAMAGRYEAIYDAFEKRGRG